MTELRERFIEDLLKVHSYADVTVLKQEGREGRFKCAQTHSMWLGYCLFNKASFGSKLENPDLIGTYILANHTGPGVRVTTGFHPYVHRGKGGVYKEADRLLQSGVKGSYLIYRCVGAVVDGTVIS